MESNIRWYATAGMVLGMLLAVNIGCQPKAMPIADYHACLPAGVNLPPGFHPLRDHSNTDDPQDSYNGWPRYIVSVKDHMIMAYVPAQTVMIGGGLDEDEVPARQVVVNHFYMDIHEVTNIQFDRFYRSCRLFAKDEPEYSYWTHKAPRVNNKYMEYFSPGANDAHPVRNVSWWDAWSYGQRLHKELPTEAQWEAAARGDDRRIFPWGNEDQSEVTHYLCNARTGREDFDGYEYTAPVKSYSAGISPFGIFNMAGNVGEWCADWYDPGRYAYPSEEDPPTGLERGARPFGDRNYPNPPAKKLRESRVGPIGGDQRVIRGGSFTDDIERCRVDVREGTKPEVCRYNVGFRCVLPLPPTADVPDS